MKMPSHLNDARKIILLSFDRTKRREVGGGVVGRELSERKKKSQRARFASKMSRTYAKSRTSRPESFSESERDMTIKQVAWKGGEDRRVSSRESSEKNKELHEQ